MKNRATLGLLVFLFAIAALPAWAQEQNSSSLMKTAQDIVFQGKVYSSLTRDATILFDGEVEELRVRPGQAVKRGEVLLTYQLTPEVMSSLRSRVSTTSISELEARLASIDADILSGKTKMKELQSLRSGNFIPESRLDEPKNALAALQAQRQPIEKMLALKKRLLEDDVKQLQALLGDVISLDKIPSVVQLKSPIDGHVTTLAPNVRPNSLLRAGTVAMFIGVMDPMLVRAQVFETEALRIKPGDKATMTLPSLPGKTFDVVLSRVNLTPSTQGIDQPTFYEVELTAPNPELLLREGLKVFITFAK
ncbi:efflux RND transporter periplasmic adaptor subunit [Megalodesulfovibrio paquesii]